MRPLIYEIYAFGFEKPFYIVAKNMEDASDTFKAGWKGMEMTAIKQLGVVNDFSEDVSRFLKIGGKSMK